MIKLFLKILFFILFVIITNFNLNSQTKEDIFNYFKDKLTKIETISFNFVSINDPNYKGYIIANKSNMFKMALGDRILVCDGSSVWNYHLKQKQVVISDFSRTQSASLQNIFFNITQNYKPINLQSVLGTKNKNYNLLTLASVNNPSETLELSYDEKYNITNIKFNIGKNSGNIKISNIKYNPKTNKDTFKFKLPKDVEEIDLR